MNDKYYFNELEKIIPGSKEALDICTVTFKLCGYNDAQVTINSYNNPFHQRIYKYNSCTRATNEVCILYYNTITKIIDCNYCDSESYKKDAIHFKGPIQITTIEQLKEILLKVNLGN